MELPRRDPEPRGSSRTQFGSAVPSRPHPPEGETESPWPSSEFPGSPLWVSPAAATARPGFLELSGRQRPPIRVRGGARLLCIMPAKRPRRQRAGSWGGASARSTNRRDASPRPDFGRRRDRSRSGQKSQICWCASPCASLPGRRRETEAGRGRGLWGVRRHREKVTKFEDGDLPLHNCSNKSCAHCVVLGCCEGGGVVIRLLLRKEAWKCEPERDEGEVMSSKQWRCGVSDWLRPVLFITCQYRITKLHFWGCRGVQTDTGSRPSRILLPLGLPLNMAPPLPYCQTLPHRQQQQPQH